VIELKGIRHRGILEVVTSSLIAQAPNIKGRAPIKRQLQVSQYVTRGDVEPSAGYVEDESGKDVNPLFAFSWSTLDARQGDEVPSNRLPDPCA
jgi:hypothetical protein